MKNLSVRILVISVITASFSALCWSQEAPSPAAETSSAQSARQAESKEPNSTSAQAQKSQNVPGTTSTQGKVEGTSNDRLFYALPNFLSLENARQVPPLSAKQKFAVTARGSFDPVVFGWYGFLASLSQAEDSEPGFGQGATGYGKRYGAYFADGTIENFFTGAILPSVFHQDPRFFQSGHGSFFHRSGYAVSRIFVTRTDSGSEQFNYSEILGSAVSAAISTYSYHPRSTILSSPTGPRFIVSDRTLANTTSVWGSQVGYDTLTIVVKEFWPDIHRKLSKKHAKA